MADYKQIDFLMTGVRHPETDNPLQVVRYGLTRQEPRPRLTCLSVTKVTKAVLLQTRSFLTLLVEQKPLVMGLTSLLSVIAPTAKAKSSLRWTTLNTFPNSVSQILAL